MDRQAVSGIGRSGYTEVGLFATVSGSVRNLGLVDCDIAVSSEDHYIEAGGIAGYLDKGSVSGCFVTGKIAAPSASTTGGRGIFGQVPVWICRRHCRGVFKLLFC